MALEIRQIPALQDNYIYLLKDAETGECAVVDPAEAQGVLAVLEAENLSLGYVLNTHHHGDHVGGNDKLKAETGCTIVGPRADAGRIPGIDLALGEGDLFVFGSCEAAVFDVPGHTRGHIAFWFEKDDALFCGDTLFALGCGRLFEGTPAQMWISLLTLRALPAATRVYCAHEYTQANARFALSLDPGNAALKARAAEINRLRAAGLPTVPSTMGEERATNPFLRADKEDLQRALGMSAADPVSVFAEIRQRKDVFA